MCGSQHPLTISRRQLQAAAGSFLRVFTLLGQQKLQSRTLGLDAVMCVMDAFALGVLCN